MKRAPTMLRARVRRELSASGGGDQREGQPSGIDGTPDTFGVYAGRLPEVIHRLRIAHRVER